MNAILAAGLSLFPHPEFHPLPRHRYANPGERRGPRRTTSWSSRIRMWAAAIQSPRTDWVSMNSGAAPKHRDSSGTTVLASHDLAAARKWYLGDRCQMYKVFAVRFNCTVVGGPRLSRLDLTASRTETSGRGSYTNKKDGPEPPRPSSIPSRLEGQLDDPKVLTACCARIAER